MSGECSSLEPLKTHTSVGVCCRSLLSFYYQRNHVCPGHLKAEVYVSRGVETRFCQRCAPAALAQLL